MPKHRRRSRLTKNVHEKALLQTCTWRPTDRKGRCLRTTNLQSMPKHRRRSRLFKNIQEKHFANVCVWVEREQMVVERRNFVVNYQLKFSKSITTIVVGRNFVRLPSQLTPTFGRRQLPVDARNFVPQLYVEKTRFIFLSQASASVFVILFGYFLIKNYELLGSLFSLLAVYCILYIQLHFFFSRVDGSYE